MIFRKETTLLRFLYKLGFRKHIDYYIAGEFYDTSDNVHYTKKYIKKYYLKNRRTTK